MNIDELFKAEPQKTMIQMEFVEKTKSVLNKICNSYSQAGQSRILRDGEYPEESVCDKCTGCGLFMYNGEERECVQDRSQGHCFYRFCDYEQVGQSIETNLEDMFDLLSVDEIVNSDGEVKETQDFAVWCSYKGWEYQMFEDEWWNERDEIKTTTQLRELWEERGEK